MCLISIIVPLYNKEKYILNCIDSLIKQTYRNIEILIINDGSTDKSINLLENHVKNDRRIVVFNKENGGVSSARNYGLEKASGEKILFVDADDYVERDYVENLVKFDEDLIISSYITVINSKKKMEKKYQQVFVNKKDITSYALNIKYSRLLVTPYLKVFKKSIIDKYNLLFNEDISYGEDACFVFEYIDKINSMRYIPYQGYYNNIVLNTLSRINIKDVYIEELILYRTIKKVLGDSNTDLYCWLGKCIKTILYYQKNNTYTNFKRNCKNIKKFEDFYKLENNLKTFWDKIIYYCLMHERFFLLFLLYKFK